MSPDYTLLRAADVPDFTGGAPSPFLGYGRPLGATQIALNIREIAPGEAHVPPGGDPAGGHSHRTIEEIYLLVEGEVTMKVGDDVVTLGPRDAIRMDAGVPRATRNDGAVKAVLVMVSMRTEDPRAETVAHEGFWPESA